MRPPLYRVMLKGGPLHNQLKDYPYDQPNFNLQFNDLEIIRSFNEKDGHFAYSSKAPMIHHYYASQAKEESGHIVYFYAGTQVGQREISQEAPEKREDKGSSVPVAPEPGS